MPTKYMYVFFSTFVQNLCPEWNVDPLSVFFVIQVVNVIKT